MPLARYVPDRDIRLMGDEPIDLGTLGQLRDAFDESNLSFAVDIVEWASSSDAFRRIIDEQAQPLSPAAPPTGRSAQTRTTGA